jgi:hypothetical protein
MTTTQEEEIRQFGGHIPPIFTNTFHVAVLPDITKIVFGEGFPDQNAVNFHSAVMMRTSDAERLVKAISELIAKARQLEGTAAVASGGA